MTVRRARARLRRFGGDESANATIEFAIIFPVFMMILLMSIEAGVMLTRQVMLERGVDIAIRDLRLGTMEEPTHDKFKDRICDNVAAVPNCRDNLLLELAPIDTESWLLPTDRPACVDRLEDMEPVTTFVEGAGNQLMLVRACFVIDPFFPTTPWGLQLPLDESGGFQMVSASAFANEPR